MKNYHDVDLFGDDVEKIFDRRTGEWIPKDKGEKEKKEIKVK